MIILKAKSADRKVTALIFIACTLMVTGSCNLFEYSPYETDISSEYRNLNAKNIARLPSSLPAEADSFTFAFITDTHDDYDNFLDAVRFINARSDISFVLHGGDITDFGLQEEYKIAAEIISQSKKPFITVIGNHDCLSNGVHIYDAMFGDSYFCFEFPAFGNRNPFKFVFLNDNTLEMDLGNGKQENIMSWIEEALEDSRFYDGIFVVAHVPPTNEHYFDNVTEEYYRSSMVDNNVLMSLNGHEHSYYRGEYYNDGVLYLTGEDIADRQFVTVTVHNSDPVALTIERIYY